MQFGTLAGTEMPTASIEVMVSVFSHERLSMAPAAADAHVADVQYALVIVNSSLLELILIAASVRECRTEVDHHG